MELGLKIFFFSFISSLFLTPFGGYLGRKFSIVDMPGNRKVHMEPTPRTGGIGIYLSFVLGILFAIFLGLDSGIVIPSKKWSTFLNIPGAQSILVVFLASTAIFILGLLDDIMTLGPRIKLFAQVLCAFALILGGVQINLFWGLKFGAILTLFWVVGITNSFNLLDNMNGLSSGCAFIATLLFFFISIQQEEPAVGIVAASLGGALLGFLYYNFPKGKIFMGDSGSLFTGFTLASIAVMGTYLARSKLRHLPAISPILVLAVPIFDTLSVIFIRKAKGLPIFQGDKNHFSHRLVDLGLDKSHSVMLIWLISLIVGYNALLLPKLMLYQAYGVLFQAFLIFLVIIILMFQPRKKQLFLEGEQKKMEKEHKKLEMAQKKMEIEHRKIEKRTLKENENRARKKRK